MLSAMLIVASEALPVVDIDNTVFIQGGIFLALIFVLKPLLFDPWLAARDRRAQRIDGATTEATLLREQASEKAGEYDARLRRARDQALALRSERRKVAEAEEANIVGEARRDAATTLDATKQRIDAEIESARGELQGRVQALAGDITQRVLGRSA